MRRLPFPARSPRLGIVTNQGLPFGELLSPSATFFPAYSISIGLSPAQGAPAWSETRRGTQECARHEGGSSTQPGDLGHFAARESGVSSLKAGNREPCAQGANMESSDVSARHIRTGWATALARVAAAALLFELISGLAITFGPFRPVLEWGLLLHTVVGVAAMAPLTWYFWRHWQDYAGQALSDVLLLGYVGLIALAVCALSGLVLTWQGVLGTHTTALVRYVHLISTLMALAASAPHVYISWLRRRGSEI